MKHKYIDYNIFLEFISDVNDEEVYFYITNNGQSSSILELGTHKKTPSTCLGRKTRITKNYKIRYTNRKM